ncbi:uroporphyrinogen-III synthase [Robiginitalea sp. IMCC43444]|uniref:uroporphyrinogen-III synthase n=1 Tax=Robiginitalea sp. IMCC43444 TaxID=3459121 RepID=UPI00404327A7
MKRLLSTKILDPKAEALLKGAGFFLQQYDALEIEFMPVHMESLPAIFSSRNAVKACFGNPTAKPAEIVPECFCVGNKTASLLEQYGQRVIAQEADASRLARLIVKKHAHKSFIYYCSDRRLDTLPDELKAAGIPLEERIAYKTKFRKQSFENPFDGILFFSPSGVQSFLEGNELGDAWALCIGSTTAGEAKKYTDKIKIAKQPEAMALAELAIQFFSKNTTDIHE